MTFFFFIFILYSYLVYDVFTQQFQARIYPNDPLSIWRDLVFCCQTLVADYHFSVGDLDAFLACAPAWLIPQFFLWFCFFSERRKRFLGECPFPFFLEGGGATTRLGLGVEAILQSFSFFFSFL